MKKGKLAGFTEAFKRHVVREVERGKISQSEAMSRYGILGHSTVLKWCRKYGKYEQNTKGSQRENKMEEHEIELLTVAE